VIDLLEDEVLDDDHLKKFSREGLML